ncbi:hypothetical protein O4215_20640 [Rhodococcus maanshanensis]|uniref:hypothetical protein n=1 Tax=Rhodococcus maanshanensis TaxID=183556 RepID=UPI0022B4624E|nr:hypothetical protein [Rhodococcus maanshanensis]MCZ4557973.1 hypothetical protein [Rhodococcus maanshanensis]
MTVQIIDLETTPHHREAPLVVHTFEELALAQAEHQRRADAYIQLAQTALAAGDLAAADRHLTSASAFSGSAQMAGRSALAAYDAGN